MMLNGNGHHNGNGLPRNGKSQPSYSSGPSIDPTKPGEVRMLCRAIVNGWLRETNDPAKMAKALADLDEAIAHCKKGGQVHALAARAKAQVLVDITSLGMRMMEFEDKAARLDEGTPTESVINYEVRIPEARSRISE